MDANGNAGDGGGGGPSGRPPSSPRDPCAQSPDADAFLVSLAGLLIQRAPPEEIAALVLDAAKRLTASPHGYVGFVDPVSGRLICPTLTDDVWERCRVAGRRLDLGGSRGLLGWVREQRRPLISNHPADDPRAVGVPPGHLAIERLLSVPVIKGETLLGQISVANAPRDYAEGDLTNLERLAELFALALRRSLDEMELERTCRELDERVLERTGHLAEARQRLQREAVQRLRAEQDLESFFQAVPDLLGVLGADGLVKRISPSSEKIIGLTPAEIVGAPYEGMVHPDDRPALAEHLRSLARGEKMLDQELRLRHRDGSWVWLSWSGMRAPDGEVFHVVGRDISRRKGFEQALLESNERFRLIFDQSPMGAALLSRDHRFQRVNQEFCRFLGRTAQELLGMTFEDITHPEDLPEDLQYVSSPHSGLADSFVREKRYLRGDGQAVWGRVHVSPVRGGQGSSLGATLGVLAIIEDIAEQHRADQDRLLAEQRQAALLALHRMADRPAQDICDFALAEGVRLTGSDLGYLYFLNADESTLSVHSWSRRTYEVCKVPGQPEVYNLADTGLWGEAVRQRRPIITNDYAAPNPFKKGLPEGHPPLARHMNVPVFADGRVVAVAGVANKPADYDEGDVTMLQLLMEGMWSVIQRQRDQEALRQSETLFRQMFENNRSVKLLVDPADGSIVRANQAARDFYGYGPEEFAARKITEINLLSAAELGREMEKAARQERLYFEFPHRLASGEVRQVEVYSGPVTLQGRPLLYSIIHDVTARKQAELALRESEEKFAKAFQAGPMLMTITDLSDGRILEVNEAFVRASGYSREELLGRRAVELGIWCDPGDRQAMVDAVRHQGSMRDLEAKGRARDGRIFQVLLSAERIQVGGRDCLLGVALDISERKALEEQARLAQKRESLVVMAGGVAHDFNNLLQTILGNADLALMDLTSTSQVAEHLREVQAAAQRAAELAHKMLAYSGHTPFIPRALDLSGLARQALPLLRQGLPSGIVLEQNLAAGLPGLEGDQALLRQALQNLVTNAAEALDGGPGVIAISTGLQACDRNFLDSTYLGRGLTPGDYVLLRVEDSGPGMDPETASKAFDPFFTTKFPGRGLGLAVVLGVVRAHNGAVRIESREGGGSRVSLFLPVARPAPAREPARSFPPAASPLVLLVDDEEAVRLVARRMLEKHGFAVVAAEDGRQALEVLGQRGGEIGAVLLDLNMPGMSGESLVRRMLALGTGARIIVSSSLEQSEAEASLGACAIAGFIQKPYRMAALVELLRRTLGATPAEA